MTPYSTALAAFLLAAASPAQATAEPTPPSFDELVRSVHRAHWGERTEVEPRGFDASLRISDSSRETHDIETRLRAKFLAPRLLRYRVDEADTVLERGFDGKGAWARNDRGVYKLQGRHYAGERDEVRRHVRLARQLLGLTDPRRTLAALTDVEGPAAAEFQLGPRVRIACWRVHGTIDAFPMLDVEPAAGDRVALTIWIDRESSRLVAVDAWPIDAERRPRTAPERIYFPDHVDRDGVLLPTRVLFYRMAPRPEPRVDVHVEGLSLDPELTPEQLSRPGD